MESVSHRPQLQERITTTIADVLMEMLEPQGVFVMVEAEHMCMTMRGLKKPGTKTVTSCARGIYEEDFVKKTRSHFIYSNVLNNLIDYVMITKNKFNEREKL